MALSMKDLTTPLTPDEVKASIYNVLATLGTPTTSWKPGAAARTIIAALAIVLSAFTDLTSAIARSGFLELAEGDWLTVVAKRVYGIDRIEATYATVDLTVDNTAGGVYAFDAGDVIARNPSTDATYVNAAPFSLRAMQTGVKVPFVATEVGIVANALPGAISDLVTKLNGVTVTNPAAARAVDRESDALLRTRCLEKPSSLSPNGPADAYRYFARSATRADGSSIGVTRVKVSSSSSTGHVDVIVGCDSGPVDGDASDPATDLGAVAASLAANVVPRGVSCTVQSATAKVIAVTYEAWLYDSTELSDADLEEKIAWALADFIGTRPIGGDAGYVFDDALRTTIGNAVGAFHVSVTSPADKVTIGANEVPVFATPTGTVHQVALDAA